jgi:hypothetical protein
VAATASEAAFMSEGVIVGSNIGRLLFLAAWSLIGQQPGQYNSVGRSDRKRCFAAKSSWPPSPWRRWVVVLGYLKVASSSSDL